MTDAAVEKLAASLRERESVRLDEPAREWLMAWLGGRRSGRDHLEAVLGVAGDDMTLLAAAYRSLDRTLFVNGRLDLEAAGLDADRGKVRVRRRYRQLIKVFHPDRFPELAGWLTPRCQAIHDAYARFKRGDADAPAAPARSRTGSRRQDAHHRRPPGAGYWFRDPGPVWPALVARWRASLGRVHNLQQKVLIMVAIVALLPVLHLYLASNGHDTGLSSEVIRPEPVAMDDGLSRTAAAADPGPVAMDPPAAPWWYNGGGLENLEPRRARTAADEPDAVPEGRQLAETGREGQDSTPDVDARIPAMPPEAAISSPAFSRGSSAAPAGMNSPDVHLAMLERWLVSLDAITRSGTASDRLSLPGTAITRVNDTRGERTETLTGAQPQSGTGPASESTGPVSGESDAGARDSAVAEAGDAGEPASPGHAMSANGEDEVAMVARAESRDASPPPDRVKDSPNASAAATVGSAARTRREIHALLEGYRRSIEQGDLERFMDHFTRDPRENRNHGRQWFSENYGGLFRKTVWRRFELEIEDVRSERSAWVVRAHYKLQIAYPDDRRRESSGRTRYTIARDEGRWRIRAIDH